MHLRFCFLKPSTKNILSRLSQFLYNQKHEISTWIRYPCPYKLLLCSLHNLLKCEDIENLFNLRNLFKSFNKFIWKPIVKLRILVSFTLHKKSLSLNLLNIPLSACKTKYVFWYVLFFHISELLVQLVVMKITFCDKSDW